MKIASIHIYSKAGLRRDLPFKTEGLNIITGRSSTGKSALSDIIEYCMGRSSFNVPDGVIEESVSWYAVKYQFDGEQVLVAKPAPKFGADKCTTTMIRRGQEVFVPEFSELQVNGDDEAVVSLLSRLLGIPENATDVPMEQSRVSFDANIKHTLFYLFQKQEFVTSKTQLLYRQDEQYLPQTIRDTFPILFGVASSEKFKMTAELRSLQRQLRLNQKQLDQAKLDIEHSADRSASLLSEARSVGIQFDLVDDGTTIINALKQTKNWKPQPIPEEDGSRISALERELIELREDRKKIRRLVENARKYSIRANDFEFEANEQRDRLASINALPSKPKEGWQWPFAEKLPTTDQNIASALLSELASLDEEMRIIEPERPQLDAYLIQQENEIARIQYNVYS